MECGTVEDGLLSREEVECKVLADDLSCSATESPDVTVVEIDEPTAEERDQGLILTLIHLCV